MIEEVGRCVLQRVTFSGHRTYRRTGPAVHAPLLAGPDEGISFQGVHAASARMQLAPGETVAVWDIPADEHREFADLLHDLPPVPSRLLIRTADRKLLELDPTYILASNRPDD